MDAQKITSSRIAGVVILYNSDTSVIDNIRSYILQIDRLYVVDNSTTNNVELVDTLKREFDIIYHSFGKNIGIASALNWAANQAIHDGYDILLTMDDDTSTPAFMVENLLNFWRIYSKPIGIISGVHHKKEDEVHYRELPYTLTSGNLLNLMAFSQVGPFRDDFFIDHVDHEFGLRLNNEGFKVVEIPSIRLIHRLGCSKSIRFGNTIIMKYGTHSATRLYYFSRNGIYTSIKYFKTHPTFILSYFTEMVKRFIKAIFLDQNKLLRNRMILKGFFDGIQERLGKLHVPN